MTTNADGLAIVLATGAGAASSHPWMRRWAALLGRLGRVRQFDYPYLAEGRKRPDPLPKLIEAHRAALAAARRENGHSVVLVGKSMGSRVGCHVSLEEEVSGLVCLGYPLCGGGDREKLRDQVLYELRTPVLFVQGTRDELCPLDLLETVRKRMRVRNEVEIIEGGDHSLQVRKSVLKEKGETQEEVDLRILSRIGMFIQSVVKEG